MVLCALGDLLLDVIARLHRPLVLGDDVTATTRMCAGGQAANVAAWAAHLGATARYIGPRADDAPGRLVQQQLAQRGVQLFGPAAAATGVVVSLVGNDRDRSMISDRRSSHLHSDDLQAAWFSGCDLLHVSGYALSEPGGAEAARTAAEMARARGGRVSLDAASATLISTVGSRVLRARVADIAPDVVFATSEELSALRPDAPICVVKRGVAGCTVVSASARQDFAAVPAMAVDATGAGDAFAAGYLVGGVQLGLEAGARCVETIGAMP